MAIVFGLVVIALWLWMARANGQGRNWARILSTVLSGLATLQLISQASVQQPVSHAGFGMMVFGVIVPVLALVGRPGRGVAGVAPGLQRVLHAVGLHAGRAQRTAVFPDWIVQLRVAASVVSRVDGLDHSEQCWRNLPAGGSVVECRRTRAITRNATG